MTDLLKKAALDGNVETMILATLRSGANYGYQMIQDLNHCAPHLLKFGEGTVYPILHRLERRKLIKAEWRKAETGRRRKYYSLTQGGRAALAENEKQWQGLMEAMQAVLQSEPESKATPTS